MSSEDERYDHATNYELIERAMSQWRAGEGALWSAPWVIPSVGAAHERAIALGVELLRRYETMSELVAAYYRTEALDAEEYPNVRENEQWVDYACRMAGAWQANRSIVEDASYFRRSRELILEATAEA